MTSICFIGTPATLRASVVSRRGSQATARSASVTCSGEKSTERETGVEVNTFGRRAVFGWGAAVAAAATLAAPELAYAASARVERRVLDDLALGESELKYQEITLGLIGNTADLIEGKSSDIDGWLAAASTWNVDAKSLYSPKKQGRSFLMTTKLVAYIKNSLATLDAGFDAANPPYSVEKTKEWLIYAEGFTAGTLQGDEARSAFARATWGNYDKSDKLNRIGLCAFGETAGTKALGVNCDGY